MKEKCCICGKEAKIYYNDKEDLPVCNKFECQYRTQECIDQVEAHNGSGY